MPVQTEEFAAAAGLGIGTTVLGEISQIYEQDFFQIQLTAGEAVRISMEGSGTAPLLDPALELLDSDGNVVSFSSDIDYPTNRNAEISFIAPETGIYIVDAYASGAEIGAYNLTIAATVNTPLNGIDWGTQLSDTNVTVYFGQNGEYVDGYYDYYYGEYVGVYSAETFTSYEIAAFWQAFSLIEAVTNLTFTEVSASYLADFELYVDTDELSTQDAGLLGYFNPPGEYDEGMGVFNGAAWDRTGTSGSSTEMGGYSFATIVHEVMHGLGLAHPHDDGGTSELFPGVYDDGYSYTTGNYDLNQGVYTGMTYNSGLWELPDGFTEDAWGDFYNYNWGFEIGPMALDIALLQDKYGANMSTATGDDVYELPDNNQAGTGWISIWDAGGNDTISYSGNRSVQIDLREATLLYEEGGGGYLSAAYDVAGGYTIANGVVIENAMGGNGADTLTGNDTGNLIRGGNGADTIDAGAGDDVVYGGNGADTIQMGDGDDVFHDNTQGTIYGYDTVYGGAGNDTFNGGWGDDTFYGNEGDDTIDGGNAFDFIDAGGGNDIVYGGTGKDTVYLSDGNDYFEDEFQFGWRAQDTVYGGIGNDTIVAYGGEDILDGGAGDDDIIGGAGNDQITGGAGNDTLRGSWHDDSLYGGAGDDILTGGYHADTFYFEANGGHDTITDLLISDNDMLLISTAVVSNSGNFLDNGGASVTAAGVVLDFGSHGSITITNLTSLDDLPSLLETF